MNKMWKLSLCVSAVLSLAACSSTSTNRVIETAQVKSAGTAYQGPRVPVAIGKFDNRSNFMRGVFTDGVDRLGSQAKTILTSHLRDSQRFNVLERENLEEAKQEAAFQGQTLTTKGADFIVTGAVAEFGRKDVGDQQFFGLLGRGKTQVAYAKVTLNVVNVKTSEVLYSSSGAGEYELSTREVVGFGSTASYDATLNGKVLDLAMREAVDKLAQGVDSGSIRLPAR